MFKVVAKATAGAAAAVALVTQILPHVFEESDNGNQSQSPDPLGRATGLVERMRDSISGSLVSDKPLGGSNGTPPPSAGVALPTDPPVELQAVSISHAHYRPLEANAVIPRRLIGRF
jgi:hypothetical protein